MGLGRGGAGRGGARWRAAVHRAVLRGGAKRGEAGRGGAGRALLGLVGAAGRGALLAVACFPAALLRSWLNALCSFALLPFYPVALLPRVRTATN